MNIFWRVLIQLLEIFIPKGPEGDLIRGKLYKPFLKKCGKNLKISSNVQIYNPEGLSVGDNVYIGYNTYLGQGKIYIGDEVLIGPFVSITASNHLRKNNSYRFGGYKVEPINIGKGTWVASHTCILAGVSIGKGNILAAGSVITKSFGDNLLIAGVPAKIVKYL